MFTQILHAFSLGNTLNILALLTQNNVATAIHDYYTKPELTSVFAYYY